MVRWLLCLTLGISAHGATYTTTFPGFENPILDGGKWVGGQSAGGNLWGNVQTTPGLAFGVSLPTTFGDPTAILTGTWGPDQSAQAVVVTDSGFSSPTENCCYEVEIRLRTTISLSSITGYEVYCSVLPGNQYSHIAVWDGPNGSWANIADSTTGCSSGDVWKATASGSTITAYKNGTQIMQVTDTRFATGNPGIGFYDGQDNKFSTFGFSSFSVTDGQTDPSSVPEPSMPLMFIGGLAAVAWRRLRLNSPSRT